MREKATVVDVLRYADVSSALSCKALETKEGMFS